MARGGHNAKPTALKLVQGTARRDRVPANEPAATPVADLKPPAWLDATAKRCWRDLAPVLRDMGLLTAADVQGLALYCQAYSRYRATLDALKGMSPDHENYRQVVITLEKAEAAMRLMATDFGMNPASRSRLSVGAGDRATDPMEELLDGRRRA